MAKIGQNPGNLGVFRQKQLLPRYYEGVRHSIEAFMGSDLASRGPEIHSKYPFPYTMSLNGQIVKINIFLPFSQGGVFQVFSDPK